VQKLLKEFPSKSWNKRSLWDIVQTRGFHRVADNELCLLCRMWILLVLSHEGASQNKLVYEQFQGILGIHWSSVGHIIRDLFTDFREIANVF